MVSHSINIYSQIKIKEVVKIGDTIVTKPKSYDGYSDFSYHEKTADYKQYIGYDIFIGNSIILYSDKKSILNVNNSNFETYIYKPKIYKISHSINGESRDEKLMNDTILVRNKIYKIIDINFENDSILDKIRTREYRNYYTGEKQWSFLNFSKIDSPTILFKLEDNETKEIFYTWSYISKKNHPLFYNVKYQNIKFYRSISDFIFVPFFENIKKRYNNKEIILLIPKNGSNFTDLYTSKDVKNEKYSKWKCEIEVMNSKNVPASWNNRNSVSGYQIFFNLTNQFGESIALPDLVDDEFVFVSKDEYNEIVNESKLNKLQKEKKENDLISLRNAELKKKRFLLEQKYGTTLALLLINNNVKIGMNSELCEISWGKPLYKNETINTNGNFENWHYGGNLTLRFFNDKLVEINK